MTENNNAPMVFDQKLANEYMGKYILIGVSHVDENGELYEQYEMHGVVKDISSKGVEVDLKGTREGEKWKMPPALNSIQRANPGIYTLKSTGEKIEDPDLLVTWTITDPPEPGKKFSKKQMEGIDIAQANNKIRFDNKAIDE